MSKKELKEINRLFDFIEKDIESNIENKIYENSRECTKKTTHAFANIMAKHALKVKGFTLT